MLEVKRTKLLKKEKGKRGKKKERGNEMIWHCKILEWAQVCVRYSIDKFLEIILVMLLVNHYSRMRLR